MRRSILGVLLLAACGPSTPATSGTPTPNTSALIPINANAKDKVDLLFMVDNSPSMDAMQAVLKQAFFAFFAPFDDLARQQQFVDFHIAVVTSDYGAGATGAPGCGPSPGGQQGHFQVLGATAAKGCVAPVGAPYIAYSTEPSGANNLPTGQDLATTFTCMASVGASGCGFEHQLESVYAALHGDAVTTGFLRDDAALAIAFLTNEDDASTPPDSDVFDKNKEAQYGYEDSYSRQTRFAVVCCPPGKATCADADLQFPPYDDSMGALSGCRAAPNPPGLQFDVRRYIDYFAQGADKGGIKQDPDDVILYAIDGPESPFQTILSNPGTVPGTPYVACAPINETADPACVPVLQHSCVNAMDPALFADPAVRLNRVIRAVPHSRIWSICDSNYGDALKEMSLLVAAQLGGGCLADAAFAQVSDPTQVDCRVADVQVSVDVESQTAIPACNANTYPCWRIEPKTLCKTLSAQGLGLTIDRGGGAAPPDTYVQAACGPKQGG